MLRLLDEAQQLLETGEMDLQRAREAMKSIRRGDWKLDDLVEWAQNKERELDIEFTKTTLPAKADEHKIKELLLNCLESHYGSLDKAVSIPGREESLLREIAKLTKDYT